MRTTRVEWYLAYFQGRQADWDCHDQRLLRHLMPENRMQVYDIRQVIQTIADVDSVLELRREFARMKCMRKAVRSTLPATWSWTRSSTRWRAAPG